jgi:hypothetical protein
VVAVLEMMVVDYLATHLEPHTAVIAAAVVAAGMGWLSAVLHSGTQSAADSLSIRVHSIPTLCQVPLCTWSPVSDSRILQSINQERYLKTLNIKIKLISKTFL